MAFNPYAGASRAIVTPAQEQGIFTQLGSGLWSGIGAIGSLFDVPGGIVRNALGQASGLENSGVLGPIASPMASVGRTGGRELLSKWGMAPENVEAEWWSKDWWKDLPYDIAGFAAEVALDPLTYLTLGGSAATKAGKALKAAGGMEDFTRWAKTAKNLGKRQARQSLTVGEFLGSQAGSRFRSAVDHFAQTNNIPISEIVGDVPNYYAKFAGVGLGGKGQLAMGAAGVQDFIGEMIGESPLVRVGKSLFNKKYRNAITTEGQRAAAATSRMIEDLEPELRGMVADDVKFIEDMGLFDPAKRINNEVTAPLYRNMSDPFKTATDSAMHLGNQFVRKVETGVDIGMSQADLAKLQGYSPQEIAQLNSTADKWRTLMNNRLQAEQYLGGDTNQLQDLHRQILLGYMPRTRRMIGGRWVREDTKSNSPLVKILAFLDPRHQHRGQRGRQIPTHAAHQYKRESGLTGFSEGTYALQRVSVDEGVDQILDPLNQGGRQMGDWHAFNRRWRGKQIVGARHASSNWGQGSFKEAYDVVDSRYGRKSVYAQQMLNGAPNPEYVSKNGIFGETGWYKEVKDANGNTVQVLMDDVLTDNQMKEITSWLVNLDPRHGTDRVPAFEVNPVKAMLRRLHGSAQVEGALNGYFGFIREHLTDEGDELSQVFTRSKGVDRTRALERAGREFLGWDQQHIDALKKQATAHQSFADVMAAEPDMRALKVPKSIGDDASRTMRMFATNEGANALAEWFDWFTRKWKAGVTVIWPSFHVRNMASAMARNWQAGALDISSSADAFTLLRNKTIKGAARKYGGLRPGGFATDREATEYLRNLIFKYQVHTHHVGIGQEFMRELDSASEFVGPNRRGRWLGFRAYAPPRDPHIGKWSFANINPIGEGSALQRSGAGAAYVTEGIARLTPFLNRLKKGWDPAEAKRFVSALQVDYGNLSEFERGWMRRLFPFYTFHRGVVPWTVEELLTKPGGRVAQTAKFASRARNEEDLIPETIQQSAAIPIAGGKDGARRYMTSAGLMEEPIYGTFAPLMRLPVSPMQASGEFLRELASQSHPFAKAGYEIMSGRSTYFGGGEAGGRELQSMTPHVGQIVENVRRLMGYPESRPLPLGLREGDWPRSIEYALGAAPGISGALGKARAYTSPDRTPSERIAELSGIAKTRDVSPRQRMAIQKELLDQAMLGIGGSEFSSVSVPEETLSALPEDQRQAGERYNAIRSMMIKRLRRMKLEDAYRQARKRREMQEG